MTHIFTSGRIDGGNERNGNVGRKQFGVGVGGGPKADFCGVSTETNFSLRIKQNYTVKHNYLAHKTLIPMVVAVGSQYMSQDDHAIRRPREDQHTVDLPQNFGPHR